MFKRFPTYPHKLCFLFFSPSTTSESLSLYRINVTVKKNKKNFTASFSCTQCCKSVTIILLKTHIQLPASIKLILVYTTAILKTSNYKRRLKITEAHFIKLYRPALNISCFESSRSLFGVSWWHIMGLLHYDTTQFIIRIQNILTVNKLNWPKAFKIIISMDSFYTTRKTE